MNASRFTTRSEMLYVIAKHVHVTAVALSFAGFFWRGLLMLTDSPLLRTRTVRVLPHVIDTILLLSAIVLAVTIRQYPFVHAWLTAKVLALIAYIVVGAFALRYGRTRGARAAAWIVALAIFAYIVGVARTRDPWLGIL